MEHMPKGIRKRGRSYQALITRQGKQYSATFPTLEAAIAGRQALLQGLSSGQREGKSKTLTLREAAEQALLVKWADTKGLKTAQTNANLLIAYFGPDLSLEKLTTEKVNAFITDQQAKGSSNGTINRKLSCLSVILRTAEEAGYTVANTRIYRRKEYRGRDRFLSEEEETKLLALMQYWSKDQHYLCTLIMLDTGVRIAEALRLSSQDIDYSQGKHGILTVWETKNNWPRSVPLTERLASALKSYCRAEGPLFPGCNQDWYRVVWDRARSVLGFDDDVQFVPHILRHTCASRLVRRGVPLAMVQKWLGHRSIQSTMRYAHLSPQTLFEYVE